MSVLTAVETEAKAVRAALRGRADVLVLAVGVRAGRVPGGLSGTVIVAGLGGGLDPSLRPGDVVVDGWPDDRDLPTGARRGTIVTAEAVCATPSDKAALFRQTGAAAVDMEQAIVRRAVGEGARVVGVRAVLDPADQCLDPELVGLVDERGRPRLFR
ncbi:MAG TPA: hypothetical protein VK324_12850, partial [Tepidisphaeraceae bacterium]|nr:hypothetical protein [Tepidisphaeraceae bacterium]